jgi:hypothetical protein
VVPAIAGTRAIFLNFSLGEEKDGKKKRFYTD